MCNACSGINKALEPAVRPLIGRRLVITVLQLGFGLLLVVLVARRFNVGASDLAVRAQNFKVIFALLFLASTILHLWVSAYKWWLISDAMTGASTVRPASFFRYFVYGSVMGQFLPSQISLVGAQAIIARRHARGSIRRGLLGISTDQVFNAVIPALLMPVSLLEASHRISTASSLAISAAILILAPWFLAGGLRVVVPAILARLMSVRMRRDATEVPAGPREDDELVGGIDLRLARVLLFLAAFRYVNLVFRAFCVSLGGGYGFGAGPLILASPLVYLSMLVGITPANLGVMEWTWLGSLRLFGVAFAAAADFALTFRVLIFVSLVLTGVLVFAASIRRVAKN